MELYIIDRGCALCESTRTHHLVSAALSLSLNPAGISNPIRANCAWMCCCDNGRAGALRVAGIGFGSDERSCAYTSLSISQKAQRG
jgi:hypothetical protein